VHDKHGALIPHLTKDDFNILEDKAPQKIKNFAAENDQPLTLGILLDTSGSQQMSCLWSNRPAPLPRPCSSFQR